MVGLAPATHEHRASKVFSGVADVHGASGRARG
jgi:hypothetical protein